jgi:Arc/MetJ-type ribon-helix-helix transcriptional regulator
MADGPCRARVEVSNTNPDIVILAGGLVEQPGDTRAEETAIGMAIAIWTPSRRRGMIICHTTRTTIMATTKVAVTIDSTLLAEVDQLVAQQVFSNRSKAFQAALEDKLARMRRGRLARELAKLDPREEKALAEEGMDLELPAWPEY